MNYLYFWNVQNVTFWRFHARKRVVTHDKSWQTNQNVRIYDKYIIIFPCGFEIFLYLKQAARIFIAYNSSVKLRHGAVFWFRIQICGQLQAIWPFLYSPVCNFKHKMLHLFNRGRRLWFDSGVKVTRELIKTRA